MSNILNSATTGATNVGAIINPDGTTRVKTTDSSGLDKDSFLKLMVAQLKYQSPDSPVDTNQFMSQTAQMSQMEALQNIQKSQSTLLTLEQNAMGSNMLGSQITGTNSLDNSEITGVVTGVKLGSDGPILKIGDKEVAMSSVKEVTRPTTTS